MSELGQAADASVTTDEGTEPEERADAQAGAAESAEPAEAEPDGTADVGADEADSTESDDPEPLGVDVTLTGDDSVDAELRRLRGVDHLAVSGHQEVYENVHRGLRDMLAALDRPRS